MPANSTILTQSSVDYLLAHPNIPSSPEVGRWGGRKIAIGNRYYSVNQVVLELYNKVISDQKNHNDISKYRSCLDRVKAWSNDSTSHGLLHTIRRAVGNFFFWCLHFHGRQYYLDLLSKSFLPLSPPPQEGALPPSPTVVINIPSAKVVESPLNREPTPIPHRPVLIVAPQPPIVIEPTPASPLPLPQEAVRSPPQTVDKDNTILDEPEETKPDQDLPLCEDDDGIPSGTESTDDLFEDPVSQSDEEEIEEDHFDPPLTPKSPEDDPLLTKSGDDIEQIRRRNFDLLNQLFLPLSPEDEEGYISEDSADEANDSGNFDLPSKTKSDLDSQSDDEGSPRQSPLSSTTLEIAQPASSQPIETIVLPTTVLAPPNIPGPLPLKIKKEWIETPGSLFPIDPTKNTNEHESGRNYLQIVLRSEWQPLRCDEQLLILAIRYCKDLSYKPELTDPHKEGIREFFKKICHESRRKTLHVELRNEEKLQRILSPRLDTLLNTHPHPDELAQFEIAIAKAELAVDLGCGLLPTNKGVNGALFVQTFEDVKVGVFKPVVKTSELSIIERSKLIFGQASVLNQEDGARAYSEVAGSDLSDHLGFNGMAPKAIMTSFRGKEGAFIRFLEGYQELKKNRSLFEDIKNFQNNQQKIIDWQMMTIWNFVIGNLDPHDENIFVKSVPVNENILVRESSVKMIDHGNCFPLKAPGYFARGNLGAWGKIKISSIAFAEPVNKFIISQLTDEKLNGFFAAADEKRRKFFTQKMIDGVMQRAKYLKKSVTARQISPLELSTINI